MATIWVIFLVAVAVIVLVVAVVLIVRAARKKRIEAGAVVDETPRSTKRYDESVETMNRAIDEKIRRAQRRRAELRGRADKTEQERRDNHAENDAADSWDDLIDATRKAERRRNRDRE